MLNFEWDETKAALNLRKHRVLFIEAQSAFEDPNAFGQYDVEHSEIEDRWRLLGLSDRLRLLSVIYAKIDEKTIRLVSARRANQAEARRYTGEA